MTTQLPTRVKEAMLTSMCEHESIRAYATRASVPIEEYHIALDELRKAHEELYALKQALMKLATSPAPLEYVMARRKSDDTIRSLASYLPTHN